MWFAVWNDSSLFPSRSVYDFKDKKEKIILFFSHSALLLFPHLSWPLGYRKIFRWVCKANKVDFKQTTWWIMYLYWLYFFCHAWSKFRCLWCSLMTFSEWKEKPFSYFISSMLQLIGGKQHHQHKERKFHFERHFNILSDAHPSSKQFIYLLYF
jgi:hypothetical protein